MRPTVKKAVNAYNNMMDNGMQVLVGPTTTGASIAVADACYTDRTFMLTPSASSTDVTAGRTMSSGLLHRPQPGRWRCRLHG